MRADLEVRRGYLGGTHGRADAAIHTAYGPSRILFGVSSDAGRGEVVAPIERNGVGKSTTVRSIMGLTP